ncbi:YraN family protein [Thiotrichales bacterium HSG1]|nr:YraN family protein [Thiotrichales bacterium HSG1]
MQKVQIGQWAEELAYVYLCKQGLQPVERNYRCKVGEIDLIMLDEKILVFVEVRYRKSQRYGGSMASVNTRKQQKVLDVASCYLQNHSWEQQCRFDVVLVDGAMEKPQMNWIADAFRME